MKQWNNTASLRAYWTEMSTEQMDDLLQDELGREVPDGDKVRLMLQILEARDTLTPAEAEEAANAAWDKYTAASQAPRRKKRPARTFIKIAAVAAVLLLVIGVLPQNAAAENFWQRLARWTDSIFELFTPGGPTIDQVDYEFVTDNPGLRQVYDAVVELGITEPVVPMWLPEGYELTEIEQHHTPSKDFLVATFFNGNHTVVFEINKYTEKTPNVYHKDVVDSSKVEIAGRNHNVIQNDGTWVVVWEKDNIDCSLALDCQEEELNQVLFSIYAMEE